MIAYIVMAQVNPDLKKAAINYAIDSKDYRNIAVLLNFKKGKVDVNYVYNGQTALETLVKELDAAEYEKILECAGLLLRHGATSDKAIPYVLENKETPQDAVVDLLTAFIYLGHVSDDNYNKVVQYLLQPQSHIEADRIYWLLPRYMFSLDSDEFSETMRRLEKIFANWNKVEMQICLLLHYIGDEDDSQLARIQSIMCSSNKPEDNQILIATAIGMDNWSVVLKLLQTPFLQLESNDQMLINLIELAQPLLKDHSYEGCLEQVLQTLDLDKLNQSAVPNQTPLHYAVKHRNEVAIRVLLRHGASLGLRSANGKLLMERISMELLSEQFDHCIMSHGDKSSKEQYEILVNFMNLTTPELELNMSPVMYIAKKEELCPLLLHPLINCFLLLKWKRLSIIFNIHLFIYMLFCFTLLAHTYLRFPTRFPIEYLIMFSSFCVGCIIVYIVVCDILTYWMVGHMPNCLNPLLAVLLLFACIELGSREVQRLVSIFAIIIMVVKLMMLVGALPVPVIATHVLMLHQVTRNFVVSLLLYSILILTFCFCLYIQFGKPVELRFDNQTVSEVVPEEFLTLAEPSRAFFQTWLMFGGQMEYKDFSSYSNALVLLLFVFLSIVLMNLMSGLAVSDTQVSCSPQ